MNELSSFVASTILFSPPGHDVIATGNAENINKLGNYERTGDTRREVMKQDMEFAADIRRKILPRIEMPPRIAPGYRR